jgi:hypothetical protein
MTINPLKPKLISVIFKNTVCTAKEATHFNITEINWLMLFKEIIATYSENHVELVYTLSGQNTVTER